MSKIVIVAAIASQVVFRRLGSCGSGCGDTLYPEHCSSSKVSASKGMSRYLNCRASSNVHHSIFQKRLRNLTPEEVEEFLREDSAGSKVAPDGGEKAMALPFSHILDPDTLIIGRNCLRSHLAW